MNRPAPGEPTPSAQARAQKPLELVPILPPPHAQRIGRGADFAAAGERRDRYALPEALSSSSPVGYRRRLSMTRAQATQALALLSMTPPTRFVPSAAPVTEGELFEEASLGVLSARQSTNYRGHRQVTLGPQDAQRALALLRALHGAEVAPLPDATHVHLVLARPYRTPFTMLLTFIGHNPLTSLAGVALRAAQKKVLHHDDIPTIGYLQQLHIGILADAMERAAVIASHGQRAAVVMMAPFCGAARAQNRATISALERLAGLDASQRAKGWRLALVAQVGQLPSEDRLDIAPQTCRLLGANLLAMRSERIQPGVNHEEKAPTPYQQRQDMDVPEALAQQCGRAAYNAFSRWSGCDRERAKDLLLMERVDVLTPEGKQRLRQIRQMLSDITDRIVANLPLWADLPTGRALSKNTARGKKAFALAGQRIYIGGLDRAAIEAQGLDWTLAVRAFGAAAARSALVAELMGVVELPEGCDLLAGVCLMAGPINQNDIGKSFYGYPDLLKEAFPQHDPTSLLVWTLKAKTAADPIGNEEQLLNAKRQGALVDLRPGPHEVVMLRTNGKLTPMRARGGRTSQERAFGDQDNFVVAPDGRDIPGNRGAPWPAAWREVSPFGTGRP